MATVTVATSAPNDWAPIRSLGPLTLIQGSDQIAVLQANTADGPRILVLTGTGFTDYTALGLPSTGTITGIEWRSGSAAGWTVGSPLPGMLLHSTSGLSVSAFAFDSLVFSNGDLWALTAAANDTVTGGTGADRLGGGAGNDSIAAGTGADFVEAGVGNDTVLGEAGNDALFGRGGDDLLDPGAGRDVVRGGLGNDTIRLSAPEAAAGLGEIFDGGAGEDVLAIAVASGTLLDIGQAQVLGFEALRFDTAALLAVSATALAETETVILQFGAIQLDAKPGFVLTGAGVFALGGFAIEGLVNGSGFVFRIGDQDGAVVFGREGAQDLANDVVIGGAGASTVFGADGADSLEGGDGKDALWGEDGADTLSGGSGADLIQGDDGADSLLGDSGNDTLLGGFGADTLDAVIGVAESLDGGDGDDLLLASSATGTLDGGAGNDTLSGGTGTVVVLKGGAGSDSLDSATNTLQTTLIGGDGADTLVGGAVRDSLDGGADNDRLSGSGDADTMDGGSGADSLFGGAANDRLFGGEGNDSLSGDGRDTGADTLDGGTGADTLRAGLAADNLQGGDNSDLLFGEDGADTLVGGLGADTLQGGLGNDAYAFDAGDVIVEEGGRDSWLVSGGLFSQGLYSTLIEDAQLTGAGTLIGSTAGNRLTGSSSNDSLAGGQGNDTVTGGNGADTLAGGSGDDRFVLSPNLQGTAVGDVITAFSRLVGNRDVIDVSAFDPATFPGDNAFTSVVAVGQPSSSYGGRISYETVDDVTDYTILRGWSGSPIGPGTKVFEVRVNIAGAWTVDDFVL
jgi:Ca2+-binding RTX toxin-like protein